MGEDIHVPIEDVASLSGTNTLALCIFSLLIVQREKMFRVRFHIQGADKPCSDKHIPPSHSTSGH
jgi:hypothetical protein